LGTSDDPKGEFLYLVVQAFVGGELTHTAMAVGGALLFSLFIIYDTQVKLGIKKNLPLTVNLSTLEKLDLPDRTPRSHMIKILPHICKKPTGLFLEIKLSDS
jgi:hypothetical protein